MYILPPLQGTYVVPFPYIMSEDIHAYYRTHVPSIWPDRYEETELVYGTDYTVSAINEMDTGGELTIRNPAAVPSSAYAFVVRRKTPI